MKPLLAMLIMGIHLLNTSPVSADPFAAMNIEPLAAKITAPAFALQDLDGNETHLAHYTGKFILLNFWATWCMPCRQEMPALERLWQQYRDKGLLVLGVSNDVAGKHKRVATFVQKVNLSFPVLLDTENAVSDLYDVSGIPVSYLISRDGKLMAKIVGTREWDSPEAFALLEGLLKKPD